MKLRAETWKTEPTQKFVFHKLGSTGRRYMDDINKKGGAVKSSSPICLRIHFIKYGEQVKLTTCGNE